MLFANGVVFFKKNAKYIKNTIFQHRIPCFLYIFTPKMTLKNIHVAAKFTVLFIHFIENLEKTSVYFE